MALKKQKPLEAQLAAATASCAKAGSQLTPLRRHVLALVLQADGPLTAYQLLDRLKASRNAVPATIYRTLDFLMDQHLIHKIERLNAFIPCSDAAHTKHEVQFLICGKCGTVDEIENQAISRALASAAAARGFQPGHAIIELDGICAACAAAAPAS